MSACVSALIVALIVVLPAGSGLDLASEDFRNAEDALGDMSVDSIDFVATMRPGNGAAFPRSPAAFSLPLLGFFRCLSLTFNCLFTAFPLPCPDLSP